MRNRVLTVLTLASWAATAAPATAQQPDERIRTVVRAIAAIPHVAMYQRGGEEQTDRQAKTFKIGAQGDIDVYNIAGDITISRGGSTEATIEIVKRARGRSVEDAREMLELVQVDVTEHHGRVEVRTRYPQSGEQRRAARRNVNVSVAYTITAPAGTRVVAKSISGDLKATGIKGDLTLETISGSVTIADAGRIAGAKSLSGDVTISDTQVDGGVEASSVSGTVTLRAARARRVDLGSISGNIVLQDVDCDTADLHSFSGDVVYGGALRKSGRYEMKSHSGDVRIAVSGTTGFEIEATTFSGSVRSDLQLQLSGTGRGADRSRQRAIRGTYGDGSAIINVTTFSGSVVVSRR